MENKFTQEVSDIALQMLYRCNGIEDLSKLTDAFALSLGGIIITGCKSKATFDDNLERIHKFMSENADGMFGE